MTVLLISAVQQFVGWKYIGVLSRQVVAHVQDRVLPWARAQSLDQQVGAPKPRVVTLMIGDELFASRDGFDHRVPLPPDRVHQLLTAVFMAVPPQARLVIDFDLAPRVGENLALRQALDALLEENANRLLMVEPAWAPRHAETLARQLDWAWRMCRVGAYRPTGVPGGAIDGAVLVQSTLASGFGVIVDSLSLSGEHGPAWDIGRAVGNPVDPAGRKRNPICDRLQGNSAVPSAVGSPVATDPLMLQLVLAKELQQYGALQIGLQPAAGHGPSVQLRSEYLHESPACQPGSFDQISTLPCLRKATVVVIGGAWSYGFGDRQDTFVGEVDGALVHAAWAQSWLQPVEHLNKAFEIVLDVLIIEMLLHPVLKFAFEGTRRHSDGYRRRVNSRRAHPGLGRQVVAMLAYLALAVTAFVFTVFTLIVIDGLLRWTFDRSLGLDTTILALLTWSVVEFNSAGAGSHDKPQQEHDGSFPVTNTLWLLGILALGAATTCASWHAAQTRPSAAPALFYLTMVGVPAVFLLIALLRRPRGSDMERAARARDIHRRWRKCRERLMAMRGSVCLSLCFARSRRPSGWKGWCPRLADTAGVLMWLFIWVYGLWVLIQSTLWGPMLELLGG